MAYSEEKDLIQNVKDLSSSVDQMCKEFSQVEPSIQEVLALRDEFTELSNKTTGVIKMYENTLKARDAEYGSLLEDCRSQFKQVTNDVESLVNLEVNFEDIKERIEQCIKLSDTIAAVAQGPFVVMKGTDDYVDPEDRLPFKHYLKVIDSAEIKGDGSSTVVLPTEVKVSPVMAISYDAE
jgi:vacuolar-type H+-ATPase subunit I/STV1